MINLRGKITHSRGILATVLLLFFPALPSAQEKPRAEELLAWFPMGEYTNITHVDFESMEKSALAEELQAIPFLNRSQKYLNSVPQFLREGIRSATFAYLTELDQIESGEDFHLLIADFASPIAKKSKGHKSSGAMGSYQAATERVRLITPSAYRGRLEVIRYDLLDPLIGKAESEGLLRPVLRLKTGRPIYIVNDGPNFIRTYVYAALTQELLITDEPGLLALSVMAGSGLALNIMDNPDFLVMERIVPKLGQHWDSYYLKSKVEGMLAVMTESGESPQEIEKLEEELEGGGIWSFKDISLGSALTERTIFVFGDEEFAARNAAFHKRLLRESAVDPNIPEKRRRFLQARRASTTVTQDGAMVILTTVYNESLFKSAQGAAEEMLGATKGADADPHKWQGR
jgi:hypothetical protein